MTLPLVALSLAACQKAPEPAAPQSTPPPTPTPTPKVTSAEPTRFDEIARHLDAGGDFYFILSTEATVRKVSAALDTLKDRLLARVPEDQRNEVAKNWDLAIRMLRKGGVGDLGGVGFSSIAVEPGVYQFKSILHHPEGKGTGTFWKMVTGSSNALSIVPWLPEKTALVSCQEFSLQPLWELVKSDLPAEYTKGLDTLNEAFRSKANLDLERLIRSLGPLYALVITLDGDRTFKLPDNSSTIPYPALALVIQVTDPEVRARIEQALAEIPGIVDTDENGVSIKRLAIPLPEPLDRPAIAWKDDLFFVSSNETLVQEMSAVKAGKKPGLAAQPGFQKIADRLPKTAVQFAVSSPAYMTTLHGTQKELFKFFPPAAFEKWTYSVTQHAPAGLVMEGQSPISIADSTLMVLGTMLDRSALNVPKTKEPQETPAEEPKETAPETTEETSNRAGQIRKSDGGVGRIQRIE